MSVFYQDHRIGKQREFPFRYLLYTLSYFSLNAHFPFDTRNADTVLAGKHDEQVLPLTLSCTRCLRHLVFIDNLLPPTARLLPPPESGPLLVLESDLGMLSHLAHPPPLQVGASSMSPKCRKGCLDSSGHPPPLKGHKCPFRKVSQAQPIHLPDESTRPSKRQKTQSHASGPPGDPTHVISPVDTEIVSVPGPLLTLPIFDAIDLAASSSMTPSDDGIEPANCKLNDGEINFTDFLHFLNGYSAEMREQDKISGPPSWYSLEDLLSIDAGSNLMQGVTDGHLSGNEVELDVLEGAGITLELNTGDMNACMATELSSKDTNVHGTDIAPEPSAGDVDYDVLIRASCHADEPDQIVDGRYRSSDFTLVDNVAGDVAPPLQYQNNAVEGTGVQTEGKRLNKKRRRSGNIFFCADH
ncbi:hypothetical protein EV702DRAFT_1200483 [Suillus placidus]|uniref:Uncharacterized protein n=1 Tax=Suillus placidus TaxID=48579 RepID=A0A9P6ZPC8_9AGAM|nr:hypothetical protein EV702DRAFT_1200483 [Suillus placidus]